MVFKKCVFLFFFFLREATRKSSKNARENFSGSVGFLPTKTHRLASPKALFTPRYCRQALLHGEGISCFALPSRCPSLRPPISVNQLKIKDRLLSSFLLWSRLFLTASDRLLLSASSGRLLLSAPCGHPLDRLDLDTYSLLHRVRDSELNPMFFASLSGQGSILECWCLVILWIVSAPEPTFLCIG